MRSRAVMAIALACLCAACAGLKPVPTEPLTLNEEQWLAVQLGVREVLKDPGSAQFGSYKAVRTVGPDAMTVVCGTVNAKNSYGGYTGRLPYGGMLSEFAPGPKSTPRVFTPFGIASPGPDGGFGVLAVCKKYGITLDAV